jgi:hypothetical protein
MLILHDSRFTSRTLYRCLADIAVLRAETRRLRSVASDPTGVADDRSARRRPDGTAPTEAATRPSGGDTAPTILLP